MSTLAKHTRRPMTTSKLDDLRELRRLAATLPPTVRRHVLTIVRAVTGR